MTRFSETAFPMLQVRAREFAPVTSADSNLQHGFATRFVALRADMATDQGGSFRAIG
jgi:hypothetical protein